MERSWTRSGRWRASARSALLLAAALAACGGDATAPGADGEWIAERIPAPGAAEVLVTGGVRVRFTGSVTRDPLAGVALHLERDGADVPAFVTQPDSRTLLLTPTGPLAVRTTYRVRLDSTAVAGRGTMPATSWTFTTGGAAPPAITAAALMAHVEALAHDSMRGRLAGSPEEFEAAGYIRAAFQEAGLQPLGGTWLHPFTSSNFTGTSHNVIGIVPGAGKLRDDWVVVGAHYDHVGVRGGQIHNGADDNASGTAGLLELARAVAAHAASGGFAAADRRSVLFVAFGAEEAWLVGSYAFCNSEPIPMDRVMAMLNLDMIGRLRDGLLYVNGAFTASEWPALLDRHEPALDYAELKSINTDHRCFMERGRPALALFTGFHPQYHTPEDDPPLVNGPGAATVANLALRLVVDLAVRPWGLGMGAQP